MSTCSGASAARLRALLAQMNAQPAGGTDQRIVRIDCTRSDRHFTERHVDHAALAPRDHTVEAALRDEIDRMHAERRCEESIARRRCAAALHVSEYRHPYLSAGVLHEPVVQIMADAAVARAGRILYRDFLAVFLFHALGDHDESM